MDLLPKTSQEFSQTEYWNAFFKKRGEKSFEWYGEYLELCVQIHKYIKPKDHILMVGCGNSKLSMDMYDCGFENITNIDISEIVINQMKVLNNVQRPNMKYVYMDATKMSFPDEDFSVVLDKGTLDALMTDDKDETITTVGKYFDEICRVLKNGGRYVCISLLQEHILKFLLEYFPKHSCMFRVIRCFDAEQKTLESSSSDDVMAMPVFVLVITKFKALPMSIIETCLGGEKIKRVSDGAEVIEAVTSIQKAALVCNSLSRGNLIGCNEVRMELLKKTGGGSGGDVPRYTVHILDQPYQRGNGKYGVFIVPQGREIEWMFSTADGRKKLLNTAKFNRLAIVSMHRDQTYESLDVVKDELNESVKSFAPKGLKELIPYLTLGADVGHRETLISGFSKISGEFRIEEVQGNNDQLFRRLIFLNNQSVVQSEALIQTIKLKGDKVKKKIDKGYLACQHHLFMTIGVQMAISSPFNKGSESTRRNCLVVGLGGGGLCTFMHAVLKKIALVAVEIDPIMVEVAEQFFELKQDERFHVVIDDGLDFLKRCEESDRFSAILFDVDSKDVSLGMSCPPKSFLEPAIMEAVTKLLGDEGIFVLNLVCRDDELRNQVVSDLKKSFISVFGYKLDEDVNEVLYCSNNRHMENVESWKKSFATSGKRLNHLVKESKLAKDDLFDVNEFLQQLKI